MNKTLLGKYGEDLAVGFLKKQGYVILDRNFRIRGGEIDIIAIDGKVVVYVEVKTRSSHQFGRPEESVTHSKLRFLERASKFYRASHNNLPQQERIDVIAIDLSESKPQIRLIENASI